LNSEKIGKIWKKDKLSSEMIWKIQLGFLPYFSYLVTIQPIFLPYFPNLFTFQLTFPQTWREENSDLKESLETMKKRYGTYGRNVS
jgi:hypothetical protein